MNWTFLPPCQQQRTGGRFICLQERSLLTWPADSSSVKTAVLHTSTAYRTQTTKPGPISINFYRAGIQCGRIKLWIKFEQTSGAPHLNISGGRKDGRGPGDCHRSEVNQVCIRLIDSLLEPRQGTSRRDVLLPTRCQAPRRPSHLLQ